MYGLLVLFVVSLLLAITHLGSQIQAESPQLPTTPDVYSLWQLTNAERVKAGIPALTLNPLLNQSAADKCADMVAHNYWDHADQAGNHANVYIQKYTPSFQLWGENLSEGFDTSAATVQAWMLSKAGHREAMLNPSYTDVGFAVCSDAQDPDMVVEHFIGR